MLLQEVSDSSFSPSPVPQKSKPCVCIIHAALGMSGAFVALQRQAELLADDAEFLLVIGRSNRVPEEQLGAFARVVRLPIVPLHQSAIGFLRYLVSLLHSSLLIRTLLKREKCSRVQMNCFTSHHGTVLRLLGFRGRIVTWIRSDPSRVGYVGRRSLALAHWCSDAVVAVSDYVRRLLPWPEDAVVIYDPAREMPVIGSSDEPSLVHLANYSRMKAQDVAIRAFHLIAEKHPSATLTFHGIRPKRLENRAFFDELQALAASGPGAGRIHFEDYADVTEALKGKRAALMVSRWEPFGLACQDASAHGLPVIATRSGGPQEMVADGRTGFLVDVEDVEALADRMDRLLSNPALAREMGQAGVELMRGRFPRERFREEMREVLAL